MQCLSTLKRSSKKLRFNVPRFHAWAVFRLYHGGTCISYEPDTVGQVTRIPDGNRAVCPGKRYPQEHRNMGGDLRRLAVGSMATRYVARPSTTPSRRIGCTHRGSQCFITFSNFVVCSIVRSFFFSSPDLSLRNTKTEKMTSRPVLGYAGTV